MNPMRANSERQGATGPLHLGTGETTTLALRANSEPLAAPQVLADNYPTSLHNDP